MYKLLPKYIVWVLVLFPAVVVGTNSYFGGSFSIAPVLALSLLLVTLLLKRVYSLTFFVISLISIFITDVYSNLGQVNILLLAFVYSASLLLTFLLGRVLRKIVNKALLEKDQMVSLYENANEGILLVNEAGDILLANPSLNRMFGYAKGELISKNIEDLIPSRYNCAHIKKREKYVEDPKHRMMCAGRDVVGKRKDGSEFPAEISLSYYKNKSKTVVIGFVADITVRKEIESRIIEQSAELEKKVEQRTLVLKDALNKLEESQKELQHSLEKQKELNEIKSKFVSMASHEFRTPLCTVLSSAELISKYTGEDEQLKRYKHIDRIKNSVHHLNDILEDFLSVGKLEEGRVYSRQTRFNLLQLMETLKAEMKQNKKEGQTITIETTDKAINDLMVVLDKKLLYNILINLLSNAIKYSATDKPIVIIADKQEDSVIVSVKDEGIGITEEDQKNLFSSFFRGANALTTPGTGLGLHIVKRYVDLMNGSINLKSKIGKGTTVSVQFPLNTYQLIQNEKEYSNN